MRFGNFRQHLYATKHNYTEEYGNVTAHIIAHVMCHYTSTNHKTMSKKKFYQLAQTFSLNKGIKKFGIKGKNAAYKEIQQLHDRVVFTPVKVETLTKLENKEQWRVLYF